MANKVDIHNINVADFVKEIDNCKGDVYLTSAEGDKLNLKSALCRVIGITRLIEGGIISNATIECELQEDMTRLFRFNLYGKSAEEK
ncbi:MAG: hypothetical protein II808_02935 [Clostridia bacterium]|nr:hypothetical protein [Clostridia bacterium]